MKNYTSQRALLVLVVFLMIGKIFAGDEVNNGSGVSEANFATAYVGLERYINLCLHMPSCQLGVKDRDILTKIKEGLPGEYSSPNQLQFLSESENPGTFIIDGEIKIAKTGDNVGSPIMINKDLLYYTNPLSGLKEGIGLGQAVQILIHEFGHHHEILDHTYLDLLGAKVSLHMAQNTITAKLLAETDRVKAVVINTRNQEEFPQVFIYFFGQIIDATDEFKNALHCQGIGFPLAPTGALYHNIYWDKYEFGNSYGSNRGELELKGHLSKNCGRVKDLFFGNKQYKARISIKINKEKNEETGENNWVYQEGSLKVTEEYDPWWTLWFFPLL